MLLMIDNYDSFTYNLVQYFGILGEYVVTIRNDQSNLNELIALEPDYIVISPGPSYPSQSGISLEVINHFAGLVPILGVCLGHQSIAQVFGGRIIRAPRVMHGKTSMIYHDGHRIFSGVDQPSTQTRYHSLVIDPASMPDCLQVTAWSHDENGEDEVIMGIRHCSFTIEGVQFHPESIASQQGYDMLRNFLSVRGGQWV